MSPGTSVGHRRPAAPDRVIELADDPARVLGADGLAALVAQWRELVDRTGGSYFQLPDWALAWWRTVGGRPPTTVALWHGPDGLDALAALSRVRQPLSSRLPLRVPTIVNTGSGAGAADHLGFPTTPERRHDVAAWVASRPGGSLVLSNLETACADSLPDGFRTVEVTRCPRLAIGEGHPMGRSASYRRQVRAKVRKARDAGIDVEAVLPESFDGELLDELMALHERRWTERSGVSSFTRDRLPLHRELVGTAEAGRGPAAVVARHDGRAVGIVYGFLQGDTFAFFQSGWDPEWSHLGLGTVVHAVGFELFAEVGVSTYDFLRGDEEYKYRFGAVDVIDTSVVSHRGVGGVALRTRARLRDAVRARRADRQP